MHCLEPHSYSSKYSLHIRDWTAMDVIRRLQYCNPCNSVGTTFSTHSHMLTHWNVHATHQEEPIIKCMINIFIRLCIHPLKPSCHLFSMQHWSGTVSLWWTPTVLQKKGHKDVHSHSFSHRPHFVWGDGLNPFLVCNRIRQCYTLQVLVMVALRLLKDWNQKKNYIVMVCHTIQ